MDRRDGWRSAPREPIRGCLGLRSEASRIGQMDGAWLSVGRWAAAIASAPSAEQRPSGTAGRWHNLPGVALSPSHSSGVEVALVGNRIGPGSQVIIAHPERQACTYPITLGITHRSRLCPAAIPGLHSRRSVLTALPDFAKLFASLCQTPPHRRLFSALRSPPPQRRKNPPGPAIPGSSGM